MINRVPAFDYAGATIKELERGLSVVYLEATAGLEVLAVMGGGGKFGIKQ